MQKKKKVKFTTDFLTDNFLFIIFIQFSSPEILLSKTYHRENTTLNEKEK